MKISMFFFMKSDCCNKSKKESKDVIDLCNFLKVISDKNRLKIICLLGNEPLCVCKIVKALNLSQKLTSHHLGQLKKVGILERKKEGSFAYYNLNKKVLKEKSKLLNQLIR